MIDPQKIKNGNSSHSAKKLKDIVSKNHVVADDNNINRFIVKTFLEKDGYNVKDVSDGKYVLELFERGETFDMVWLDLMMPEVDGVSCAKKLRETYKFKGPIVGITAHVDDYTIDECQRNGFSSIISKPITREVISKCASDFFFSLNV